ENLKFNTAIASLMEFINELYAHKDEISDEVVKTYLKVLAPLAPFTSEELWHQIGEKESIHEQSWPDAAKIHEEVLTLPVQINGHFRANVQINSSQINNQNDVEEVVTK